MLRASLRLFGSSFAVAFLLAAAQLGLAQATGIINWSDVATSDRWQATLTWIAFVYLCAVLGGAALGRRARRRPGRPERSGARVVAALAAGVGAAAAVGLTWLPGRSAQPPVNVHPELVMAMTAGAAIAAGVLLAIMALSLPPVAGSLRVAVVWAWLLAIAGVTANAGVSPAYPPPSLGVPGTIDRLPTGWWSGPYLQVAVAVVLGLAVAAAARFGGGGRFAVGISGASGPSAVAVAYLITGVRPAPLIAVGAGLLASLLVALVPGRSARKAVTSSEANGIEPGELAGEEHQAPPPPSGRARHAAAGQEEPTPTPVRATARASVTPPPGAYLGTAAATNTAAPTIGRPPRATDDYQDWISTLGRDPAGR